MFDTRKTLHDRGILDVIRILATNGESGRLEITAGGTEGMFFFKNGQLVDARLGHLTGFQAINALASVRDARFSFDPSAVPPSVSSITPSERVVLKQFFGIETIHPEERVETPGDDEVTIETNRIPVGEVPYPVLEMPPLKSFHRGGLILAALFLLIAVSAVALRNRYRERVLPQSTATAEQPVAPVSVATTDQPVASAPVATKQEPVAPASVATTEPRVARVFTSEVKDLTGRWNVVNTVEKTAFRSFQHLKIGFDLAISQNGKSFTGKGQKVSENGRSLPAKSRTPIQVEGSINGDTIEATFFEEGALRKTTGRFVWRIDKTGRLNGTFASTAAGSSGKSAARKS